MSHVPHELKRKCDDRYAYRKHKLRKPILQSGSCYVRRYYVCETYREKDSERRKGITKLRLRYIGKLIRRHVLAPIQLGRRIDEWPPRVSSGPFTSDHLAGRFRS